MVDVNGRTIHQMWSPEPEGYAERREIAFGKRLVAMTIDGLAVETPQTNLVYADTTAAGVTAADLLGRLRQDGVMVSAMGEYRIRACTHLDVDRAGVEEAVAAVRRALAG